MIWSFFVCLTMGFYMGVCAAGAHWLLLLGGGALCFGMVATELWWRREWPRRRAALARAEMTFSRTNGGTVGDVPIGTVVETADGKRFVVEAQTSETTATLRGFSWYDRVRERWHRFTLAIRSFFWRLRG